MRPGPPALLLLAAATGSGAAAGAAAQENNPWQRGIWKSPPPPENPDAEFDGLDPYGLAVGVRIETDCSIRWISPYDGNLYCFNSLTSKSFFIADPDGYIRGAKAFLKSGKGDSGE